MCVVVLKNIIIYEEFNTRTVWVWFNHFVNPQLFSHLDSNAAEDLIGAQTFVTSSCADRAPPTQIQGKNTNTEILWNTQNFSNIGRKNEKVTQKQLT